MRKYRAIKTVAMLLGLGLSSVSMAATYEIDPAHANVRFGIDHFNTSTNTGGFYNLTGEVTYNPDAQQGSASIVIPMDNLVTGNEEFDENLKGEDFFDAETYPVAKFESTEWHFNNPNPIRHSHAFDDDEFDDINDEYDNEFENESETDNSTLAVTQIDGLLTLHGETHPVSLTATKFNCYFSPIVRKKVCGGDFTTTIDRTQWGIDKYVLLGMTKIVTLDIQIEAAKR